MRSLKVNAIAWLASVALAGFASAADPIADAAVLYSHQALDGNSYFAVAVTGPVADLPAVPHDHVILVDTSASQVGEHRTMALGVLKELLASLPSTDKVQVTAVDVRATPVTSGFVSAQDAAEAVQTLNERLPAGASDLLTALQSAVSQLSTDRAASVVYIGDGMSSARLLDQSELHKLVDQLRDRQIPIHSVAIGANKDLRLLGTLAQLTGGLSLIDDSNQTAADVGQKLAHAIDLPVTYPTSLSVQWADAEVIPQRPLPLRSDRETFYLARGQWINGATLSVQTVDGPLSWDLPEAKFTKGNQYLAPIWTQAEASGGLSIPFAGAQYLGAARQSFFDRVEQLEIAADNAALKGNIVQAEAIRDELLALDPTNVHTHGLKNRIGGKTIQPVAQFDEEPAEGETTEDAPAEDTPLEDAPASDDAPADESGDAPADESDPAMEKETDDASAEDAAAEGVDEEMSAPDEGADDAMEVPADDQAIDDSETLNTRKKPLDMSAIQQEQARRKARTQKLRQQLESDIKQAKQALSTSPEAAVSLVEGSRGAIKSAMDIDAEDKAQLLKQADSALTDLKNKQEVLKGRIQSAEQRKAEQEAQQRVLDYAAEQDEKLKQLVDRIRALMEDGYHGDDNGFEEAEAVARIIETIAPLSSTGASTVFTSEAAGQLSKAERLRSLRYDRFLETLYQVELSHVPFPDEPPVRYPPAAVWQQLTLKRKKWKSVDLHKDSANEQRIMDALDQQTSLEFPDNTLKEVVDFISQYHNIPIRLDEQALTEAGLDTETRINLVISGISLRSALKLLLENVNGNELTFVIEDEVMKITTAEKANEKYQTRVYPVGDLVIPIIPLQTGGLGGLNQGSQQGGGQGGQNGQQGGGGGFFSVPAARRAPAVDGGKKNQLN